jgi:hypothetical protein
MADWTGRILGGSSSVTSRWETESNSWRVVAGEVTGKDGRCSWGRAGSQHGLNTCSIKEGLNRIQGSIGKICRVSAETVD